MKDADSALTKALLKNNRQFSFLGNITGVNIVSTTSQKVIDGKWRAPSFKRVNMLAKTHPMGLVDCHHGEESIIKLEFTFRGSNEDINNLVDDVMILNELGSQNKSFVVAKIN